jgi:hypothetical protein
LTVMYPIPIMLPHPEVVAVMMGMSSGVILRGFRAYYSGGEFHVNSDEA